jgi:hypothetical protein
MTQTDKSVEFDPELTPDADHENLIAVVIKRLLLAVKNSTLYPSRHDARVTCIKHLLEGIQSYLAQYPRLVIVVDKNRLVSDGHVLHEGRLHRDNIAFLLHRDGIQWISFDSGLEMDELAEFLDILKRYRTREEFNGGDIVTALWQAEFAHIKYATDDLFWQDEPILDIAGLKVFDPDQSIPANETPEQRDAQSLASAEHAKALWVLTEKEKAMTRRMIAEQEQRNDDPDVFDILLIILNEQNDKEDYTAVLDLVRECFEHTLARGEFSDGLTFLDNLGRIYARYKKEGFWAQAHLDDFYLIISGKHLYSGLQQFITGRRTIRRRQLDELRQLITRLPPQCTTALGKLLPDVKGSLLRRCVLEGMGIQSNRNIGPLASLTGNENDKIAIPAISLLAYIRHPRALGILRRLIRSGRESRRIAAVKALIRHPDSEARDFGGILEDESKAVVDMFIHYLRKRQDAGAEAIVADRLASGKFTRRDTDFLMKLYGTLGHCGSEQSLEVLKRQLNKLRLFSGTVGRAHQTGAALALLQLNTAPALRIFENASRNFRFSVRKACRQAREMNRATAAE